MLIRDLYKRKLISPPSWLIDNTQYLTIMGSEAYGVSNDTSDRDIYGWIIPPRDLIFPHLKGEILGFGQQTKRFEQYQEHHIQDEKNRYEYDFCIYSIIKYFQLCMENNPNMIDSLFTPQNCILHITKTGAIVRQNRKLFLHKGLHYKYKGYAYSQLHKVFTKRPIGKRQETIKKHGFDSKFLYHVVRLVSQAEQMLTEGDLDLQRNKEQLKAIRRGEVTPEEVQQWFTTAEKRLDELYVTSFLPYSPPEEEIKKLLLTCLEEHYGSLDKCIVKSDKATEGLREINQVLEKYRSLL